MSVSDIVVLLYLCEYVNIDDNNSRICMYVYAVMWQLAFYYLLKKF